MPWFATSHSHIDLKTSADWRGQASNRVEPQERRAASSSAGTEKQSGVGRDLKLPPRTAPAALQNTVQPVVKKLPREKIELEEELASKPLQVT